MIEVFDAPKSFIKVLGIGCCGLRVIDRLVSQITDNVTYIAADWDKAALAQSKAAVRLCLGGKAAPSCQADEPSHRDDNGTAEWVNTIAQMADNTVLLLIAAHIDDMVGGALSDIARVIGKMNLFTIATLTASAPLGDNVLNLFTVHAVKTLCNEIDAVFVSTLDNGPNNRLMMQAIDILTRHIHLFLKIPEEGVINLDMADYRMILKNAGECYLATAQAEGTDAAPQAARQIIAHKHTRSRLPRYLRAILHIEGGPTLSLRAVNDVVIILQPHMHPDSSLIYGVSVHSDWKDTVQINLIAGGAAK